jgi:hypothetical protein
MRENSALQPRNRPLVQNWDIFRGGEIDCRSPARRADSDRANFRIVVTGITMMMFVPVVRMLMCVFKLLKRTWWYRRKPFFELDRPAMFRVKIGTPPMFLVFLNLLAAYQTARGDDLFQRLHPLAVISRVDVLVSSLGGGLDFV